MNPPTLGVFLLAAVLATAPAPSILRQQGVRASMGCVYAIDALGTDAAALGRGIDAALDEVDRIDRLMSHYRPESALSRLNREAARRPVPVEPELFEFLARSLQYSGESDGAFDITVGPLMKVWGFFDGEGRLPASGELAQARRRVGYRHVRLNPADRTVRFDVDGVEIDLGGIAKGYAVDRAVAVLAAHDVTAALVSAGGSTVHASGAPPGLDAWDIHVQDPVAPGKVAFTVALRDRAMSIAGSTEKYFEAGGARYSHIMDPRTGRPVQGILSVVAIAATGAEADALDNVLFVKGLDESRHYLAWREDVEAYFILPQARGWTLTSLHAGRPRRTPSSVGSRTPSLLR